MGPLIQMSPSFASLVGSHCVQCRTSCIVKSRLVCFTICFWYQRNNKYILLYKVDFCCLWTKLFSVFVLCFAHWLLAVASYRHEHFESSPGITTSGTDTSGVSGSGCCMCYIDSIYEACGCMPVEMGFLQTDNAGFRRAILTQTEIINQIISNTGSLIHFIY